MEHIENVKMVNQELKPIIKMELNYMVDKKKDDSAPEIELFDRNKRKLDGTYNKVIGDSPREEFF